MAIKAPPLNDLDHRVAFHLKVDCEDAAIDGFDTTQLNCLAWISDEIERVGIIEFCRLYSSSHENKASTSD